ncbi:hypothetical protein [Flavobacterium sp. AG291]|uniref:hypothetical protein n=1 Tax=Flavobacterium sp. AG291 TaxID=2184000 RepID=UPI000E0BDCE8|nr:hypothetical protein [Flavobacterium sp. AG291]RDI07048.1 hypothetical protein DEU42_113148 [Flavobacterium sp. AG291]
MKVLEYAVNVEIPAGTSGKTVTFTPPAGVVIGCAIFKVGGENSGFVSAKITTDSNEDVSPLTHIDNYRDREAGYIAGKKPLLLDTQGKSYMVTITSNANFDTDLKAQLVLVYENDNTKSQC